jgi:hypothetical protein
MLPDRQGDKVGVEIMSAADTFSDLVDFVDDCVPVFHHGVLVGNSSGVQMMGGVKPAERHTASIVPRIVAFAKCLQFHVRR